MGGVKGQDGRTGGPRKDGKEVSGKGKKKAGTHERPDGFRASPPHQGYEKVFDIGSMCRKGGKASFILSVPSKKKEEARCRGETTLPSASGILRFRCIRRGVPLFGCLRKRPPVVRRGKPLCGNSDEGDLYCRPGRTTLPVNIQKKARPYYSV